MTLTKNENENDNLNVNLKPETAEGLEPETNLSVWEEGNRIVEREGVTVDRNIYVHSIFEYRGLVVENHHYLAAVKLSKRYRRLDEEFRRMLISEPLEPVNGSKLMTGSPMFNALFLTHHAHRHFLNEYMPMKVFYDISSFQMIVAYVKGYFFGEE